MTNFFSLSNLELDALIAERIMGWEVKWHPAWMDPESGVWISETKHTNPDNLEEHPFRVLEDGDLDFTAVPHFSSSMNACVKAQDYFHDGGYQNYDRYLQERRIIARKEHSVIRGPCNSHGEHGYEFEWIDRQGPRIRCIALLLTLEKINAEGK